MVRAVSCRGDVHCDLREPYWTRRWSRLRALDRDVCGGDFFWKAVKPLISKNPIGKDDNIFIMNNGTIANHPEALCQIFNNYFVNIASSIGPDDAILEHDTSESCTSSHANHRSVKSICESMSTKPKLQANLNYLSSVQ